MLFPFLPRIILFVLQMFILNVKSMKTKPNESVIPSEPPQTENSFQLKVESRISKLENEVDRLNSKGIKDSQITNQLTTRIKHLEDLVTSILEECNCVKTGTSIGRLRRPARLLPLQLLIGKSKNSTEEQVENIKFYGPPTNCSDLAKLGYTLNGYYLVRSQHKIQGKIQVVLCQYRTPEKQDLQTWIGNVELKTKNIHFYVQRNTPFGKKGIISFEIERLNVGGAMNLPSGVFTAPLNGTYHFQFSGVKSHGFAAVYVILQVNGADVGRALSNTETGNTYTTASTFNSLKLKEGDRVNLWMDRGQLHDTAGEHFTDFTGWLVNEDFILA